MAKKKDKISVIIPAYNAEKYLRDAVESVLKQTVPVDEIIVVDDGSTDGTKTVAKEFKEYVTYVYQENKGVAAARNRGLHQSTGHFITFIDADDIWLKNKIELQLQLFKKTPELEMIIGFLQRVYKESNEEFFKIFDGDEPGIFVLQLGSTLIRKEVFKKVGSFDEEMTLSEDLDWFLRSREVGINVEVHEDVVQLYRQHEKNITKNRKATNSFMLKAFKKSLERRRETGEDFSIGMPLFKNLDEIVKFWKKNKKLRSS
jgi:glycosyltransferase involved in cell wall biosynthesis